MRSRGHGAETTKFNDCSSMTPEAGAALSGAVPVNVSTWIYSKKFGWSGAGFVCYEVLHHRLSGFLQQDFDLLFRVLESRLAAAGQHDAALECRQGFLEGQLALFQAFHQAFELAHGGLEIESGSLIGGARNHDSERYRRRATCASSRRRRSHPTNIVKP